MNTARQKSVPSTVAQLEEKLRQIDSVLLRDRRDRNAAHTQQMPQHLASGDTCAAEECREEMARLDAEITNLTALREQTQTAIRVVQESEKAAFRSQNSLAIFKRSAALKDKICALADQQKAYGAALKDAHLEQDALESAMRGAGVEPDPDGKGRLAGTVQLSAYVDTECELGRNRTLLNLHELSEDRAGIADLKRLAKDQHEMTLRRVRTKFGVDHNSPTGAI